MRTLHRLPLLNGLFRLPSSVRQWSSVAGSSVLICALSACPKMVNIELKLVEPCDQRQQALNGVDTFEVSSAIDGVEGDKVTFTTSVGVSSLPLELTDGVIVTVEGWQGDAEQDASVLSGPPQAVGRSLPLDLATDPQALQLSMVMGKRDTFGQATSSEGACQSLTSGVGVQGRHGHTATYMPSINKVLVVGGAVWIDDAQQPGSKVESILRSAELWDPVTGTFEALPDLPNPRAYHSATALEDGRVLVVGGFSIIGGNLDTLTNGFIYDPTRDPADPYQNIPFSQQRALHTATLIEGQDLVAIIGGCSGAGCTPQGTQDQGAGDPTALIRTVEVFDASTDTTVQGEGLSVGRAMHAATALRGRVLVSGGVNASGPLCSLEIFQANGNSLSAIPLDGTTSTLPECVVRHQMVTLPATAGSTDRVAIIGGQTQAPGGRPQGPATNRVVFWNTATGVEALQPTLLSPRVGHQAALLNDGSILVVGGEIQAGGATAEKLEIQPDGSHQATSIAGPLTESRDRAAMAMLPNNQAFFSGGHSSNLLTSSEVNIYYGP